MKPRAAAVILAALLACAVAVWLWPASVQIVAWPRSGAQRIAVFAPLYRLTMLLAGGVLASGVLILLASRRSAGEWPVARLARVVAPLNLLWAWTVPYWPWLPDRWPLLVAGAGPLRWILAALAIGGVIGRLLEERPIERDQLRLPGRRAAFLIALILYVGLGVRAVTSTGLGGDEPHYLVMTESLLADGDLQIENNHTNGSYRKFFNGDLRPDYLVRGTNGAIYSIHAPGLAALVLPGYALARGLGAVLTMCLLAALTLLAVFDIGSFVGGRATAWLLWASVGITVPFIPHAWALYPEMAGAAIVAWGMRWLLSEAVDGPPTGLPAWVWRGVCLAWLPWLHTKFSVFLAGLGLLLAWRIWWPPQPRPVAARLRALVALSLPVAVSGIAWLAFFVVIYGSYDPQAPYGGYTAQFVRFENLPRSLLGLFVDQKFGLLVYAPIYALVIPGWWLASRDPRWRLPVGGAALLALAYVASSARLYMWWGGSSAPARFLVPVAPLLAPALALAIGRARGRAATTAWALAAGVSLLAGIGGALGAGRFLLFSDPHGVARVLDLVQGSAPVTAAWPTFTEENWVEPLRRLGPWLVAAIAALAGGMVCARATRSAIWIGAAQVITFGAVGSALAGGFTAAVRADAVTRGHLALLESFDPARARAFDYARPARLSPQEWLTSLAVTFDREPNTDPDPLGRISGALQLPPGEYEARVWFDGGAQHAGALQAALGNGYLLARLDTLASNPAVLPMSLPIAVPSLWMQLTDLQSARAVRRLEIVPRDVTPAAARPRDRVLAVEAFPERLNAYVAYLNEDAYPERGTFWTRAAGRARLRLAPAGAARVQAIVHVGPTPTTVTLSVGEHRETLALAGEETRTVTIPLTAGVRAVPIEIQASAFFQPSAVDPISSDTRQLGCQVRLVLE